MDMAEPTLFEMPVARTPHPAKYTDALLPVFARMLDGRARILDPFGGTGKVFLLNLWLHDAEIQAVEIEPEWAALNPRTTLGNALALPWPDGYFDAICTSPCYGNRMSDRLRRNRWDYTTYAQRLGRELHRDNAGSLQWGEKYREFHDRAWAEARRVLQPGGAFILNIKDHIRAGEIMPVTAWHISALRQLGFTELEHVKVDCPGMRYGANREKRVEFESVVRLELKGE